jgi:hypothetical protein
MGDTYDLDLDEAGQFGNNTKSKTASISGGISVETPTSNPKDERSHPKDHTSTLTEPDKMQKAIVDAEREYSLNTAGRGHGIGEPDANQEDAESSNERSSRIEHVGLRGTSAPHIDGLDLSKHEAPKVRAVVSPPEPRAQKGRLPAKVHNATAPRNVLIPSSQVMKTRFRAFHTRIQKEHRRRKLTIPPNDSTSGTTKPDIGNAQASLNTPARRSQRVSILNSPIPVKHPYSEDLKDWRPDAQESIGDHCLKGLQPPVINTHLEAPSAVLFHNKSSYYSERRTTNSTSLGQNSQAMAMDETKRSPKRSRSPISDPPSLALSELSLRRSTTPDLDLTAPPTTASPWLLPLDETLLMSPDMLAFSGILPDIDDFQPLSYLEFLNDGEIAESLRTEAMPAMRK